jgi:hypothetical protein
MDVHDDGFLEFVVRADVTLEIKHLLESKRQAMETLPGKRFFVLLRSENFFMVSRETRAMAASKEYSDHMEAVALHSRNPSLRLIGNLYIMIDKPAAPTRFFGTRAAAERWLRKRMHDAPGNPLNR